MSTAPALALTALAIAGVGITAWQAHELAVIQVRRRDADALKQQERAVEEEKRDERVTNIDEVPISVLQTLSEHANYDIRHTAESILLIRFARDPIGPQRLAHARVCTYCASPQQRDQAEAISKVVRVTSPSRAMRDPDFNQKHYGVVHDPKRHLDWPDRYWPPPHLQFPKMMEFLGNMDDSVRGPQPEGWALTQEVMLREAFGSLTSSPTFEHPAGVDDDTSELGSDPSIPYTDVEPSYDFDDDDDDDDMDEDEDENDDVDEDDENDSDEDDEDADVSDDFADSLDLARARRLLTAQEEEEVPHQPQTFVDRMLNEPMRNASTPAGPLRSQYFYNYPRRHQSGLAPHLPPPPPPQEDGHIDIFTLNGRRPSQWVATRPRNTGGITRAWRIVDEHGGTEFMVNGEVRREYILTRDIDEQEYYRSSHLVDPESMDIGERTQAQIRELQGNETAGSDNRFFTESERGTTPPEELEDPSPSTLPMFPTATPVPQGPPPCPHCHPDPLRRSHVRRMREMLESELAPEDAGELLLDGTTADARQAVAPETLRAILDGTGVPTLSDEANERLRAVLVDGIEEEGMDMDWLVDVEEGEMDDANELSEVD